MKNSTFYDPLRDPLLKTKRWLVLLSFLTLLLGGSHSTYAQDPCLISVTIEGTSWGDEVTWDLKDASDQTILSGGPYFGSGQGYSDTQTTLAINPPYTLVITIDG